MSEPTATMRRRPRRIRPNGGAAIVTFTLVSVLGLAGCGIADSPAPSGNAGGGSDKDYSAIVDAARAGFPVDWQGPSEPAPAPKNIKFAAIGSAAACSGCWAPVLGMQRAAEALGWDFQSYDGQGDPAKQNAAFLSAIASGADVIAASSIDPSQVQSGMQAAVDAGIPIVSGSSALSAPNSYEYADGQVQYAFDVSPDYAQMGRDQANWIAEDSDGKAVVGVFGDWEFPSVIANIEPLIEELDALGVTQYPLEKFTVNQVSTTLGPTVVGFLKSHPDVTYIVAPHDPGAAAMVAAIQQAGLADSVKVVSIVGSQQNLDFIRNNQVQVVDEAYDNEYMGWAIVDQSIRLLNGQDLSDPINENMPYILLDETNLPAPGSDWIAEFDYKSQFKELWAN